MNTLDKLLEIENDEELYHYSFSYRNTLMYPFIRFVLLRSAFIEMHEIAYPYDNLHPGLLQGMNYIFKSFWFQTPKHTQADIVFFGFDQSNIPQGNAWFNRLTESFANEYASSSIVIERSGKLDYKRPRTYPKVFARDMVYISATLKTKWRSASRKDIQQIDSFLLYLKKHLKHEFKNSAIWDTIKNRLVCFAKELPFIFESDIHLLKRLSPKIIFLECACYGGKCIPLIMAAKELNIPVGEYQHGLLSLAHPAYNYSAQLSDSYKYYMPDFFMSYGTYWTKNSRISIKMMEIGNPYLSDTVSMHGHVIKKEQLLYISTAFNPEQSVKETLWLHQNLAGRGCSVIFRIHPSETSRLQTVYKPIVDAGIPIDTQPLYDTLKHTKYLFGDYSTVLFEATMFDCIIFLRDTPLNRENMDISQFNACQSVEELVESIFSKNYHQTGANNFWTNQWREKYHQLIDNIKK